MTIKEIAYRYDRSERSIQRALKKKFPNDIENGKKTFIKDEHVNYLDYFYKPTIEKHKKYLDNKTYVIDKKYVFLKNYREVK
jgi:phosphatidylserine/phosphatidylglycerophosphate/cardiolipin synthase-like enzyme